MNELDCREIEERLPWYLHGGLPPEERQAIEDHLRACANCRAALAATNEASALFGAHPEAGTVVDYGLGLPIETKSRGAVELHLAHCAECQDELRLVAAEHEGVTTDTVAAAGLPVPSSQPSPAPRRWTRTLALAATVAVSSGLAVHVAMRDRSGHSDTLLGRVALVELLPEGSRTRGVEEAEIAVSAALHNTLLLVTDRAEAFDEVRARVVPRGGGQTLRELSGLMPALGGGYALLLPAGATPHGEFEIELEGRLGGEWSLLGRYRLRVDA